MATLDMSRLSQGVNLPPEVSGEILGKARATNPFAQLAAPMQMSGVGKSFTAIVSEPKAQFVEETGRKPISNAAVETRTIFPYKVAVISPYSMEFVRDAAKLYAELTSRLPDALTRRIVEAISGTDPHDGVTSLAAAKATTFDPKAAFASILDVERTVAAGGGQVSGYALTNTGRIDMLSATDTLGRPLLFSDIAQGTSNLSVMGAPAIVSRDVAGPAGTVGFAGDWRYARYGTVDNVSISVSTEAAYTGTDGQMVSAFESNMVLVRAEVEFAFYADLDKFTRLVAPADKPAAK